MLRHMLELHYHMRDRSGCRIPATRTPASTGRDDGAKGYWVTCPDCGRRYYVSTSLQGKNVDLMCPFCKLYFANPAAGTVANT